ncbi:unnamed protein product [Peronospora destructor]|uniref:Reverse transcriptase n=1 Tax=Peronospora destructor TaxID=86335 RepID=A0AAV0TLB9_9STRA|nr:unnamed protein product [Peronospora destructor]
MVERPQYMTPEKILLRPGTQVPVVSVVHGVKAKGPESVPSGPESREGTSGGPESVPSDPKLREGALGDNQSAEVSLDKEVPREDVNFGKVQPEAGQCGKKSKTDTSDEQVCVHEGGDLCAEDIDTNWSIIPEVIPSTDEVTLEDIQILDPGDTSMEEVDRLRQIIWRKRHLLMGKGNALPPAARGAVCDIDVGNARPIAQRVRKVAPQLREKLSDLIKGLLSSKIIQHSTSPWASPIVIIVKKNGVDIRLGIDYRLVNS